MAVEYVTPQDGYVESGFIESGLSINWGTKVIYVPKFFLTHLGGTNYELDTNAFRMALKDLEDSPEGMTYPDTNNHNTSVLLGGIVYARIIEMINGYTVTFEDGLYSVSLTGSNNNILDVTNLNQVAIRSNNSAGLVQTREIEQSAFNGYIAVDPQNRTGKATSSTLYPAGTEQAPCLTLLNAKLIGNLRGISKYRMLSNITIGAATSDAFDTESVAGFTMEGVAATLNTSATAHTAVTMTSGCRTGNTTWKNSRITGYQGGESHYVDCMIDGIDNAHCIYERCGILDGTVLGYSIRQSSVVGNTHASYFKECFSDEGTAILDRNGTALNVTFDGFFGRLKIINQNGTVIKSITGVSWSGGSATFTSSSHGALAGQRVTVSGITPTGYNGSFVITSVSTSTFTVAIPYNPGTYVSGGASGMVYGKNANVWVHLNGGTLTVDPSCTTGKITVTGTGSLVNMSAGTEVDSFGFIPEGFVQSKLNIESTRISHQGYGERWFVDPVSGNDLSPGSSSQSPFKTVKRAMDAAFSGRGDVIYLLSPGGGTSTINERIVVDKEDVHIRAPGRGLEVKPSTPSRVIASASHDGSVATFSLASTEGLSVGNPITVSGFAVTGYNGEHIVTGFIKDVSFTVALVTSALAADTNGTLSKVPTISIIANNCSLSGMLVRAATNSSDDCIMINAKFSKLENLYVVGADSGADPQNPVTTDNCIHYRGGDYHKLLNSEIEKAGADGIRFTDAPINGVGSPREVRIDGCNLYFNRGFGLNFTGTSTNSTRLNIVTDCRIQHNSGHGVHIGPNTQRTMIMANNYIKDNRTYPTGIDDPANEILIDPLAEDAMVDVFIGDIPSFFHGLTHDVESSRKTHQGFGNRFYVNGETGDDLQTGSTIDSAVKTIARAVEMAVSGRGDVIYLLAPQASAYTYTERVVLDKEDVHLRGPGRGVNIQPASIDAVEPVIRVTANNCSMSGFVVRTHLSETTSDGIVISGKFSKLDKLYIVGPGQTTNANTCDGVVYTGGDYHEMHDCESEKFGGCGVEFEDLSAFHANGAPREVTISGGNFYLNGGDGICINEKAGAAAGTTTRLIRIVNGVNCHDNLGYGISADANVTGVVLDSSVMAHSNNGGDINPQINLLGTYHDATADVIDAQTQSVWDATAANFNTAGSMGNKLNTASSGGVDYQALADAIRVELTPELTHVMLLENGLTASQATVLQEIYQLYGLDPTKPLIVSTNSRTAGAGITQTISTNPSQTTITRV
jgi:hypothetical protein